MCHRHNRIPPQWRAACPHEVEAIAREVRLPSGSACTVTSYQRHSSRVSNAAAVLTFSAPEAQLAGAHHALLAELSEGTPVCGRTVDFSLFALEEEDHWGRQRQQQTATTQADAEARTAASTGLSVDQLHRLHAFLRSRLLEPWLCLAPRLHTMRGSLEFFNPSIGANMGWHQDGHESGCFIAHFYLPGDISTDPETEEAAMDWFEVALPPCDNMEAMDGDEDDADEEDAVYGVEFVTDEAPKALCRPSNFLAFSFAAAALQPIVIFEDAGCYHRTPLTALAVPKLQERRRRPVVRMVFYALDVGGNSVGFPHRLSSHGDVAGATDTTAASQPTLVGMCLPLGLRRLLEQYATYSNANAKDTNGTRADTGEGIDEAGLVAELQEAFEQYVGGCDQRMMHFIKSSPAGGGRRAGLCERYHVL
jgi:hypothetical protein